MTSVLPAMRNGTMRENCTPPYEVDQVPLMVLYSVVLFVGLPTNMATIFLTFMQVRRKNVLGIYLLSLSLCDLMYLCTLPLWIIYVSYIHVWQWNSLSCKITGYIFFTNMYISIFLLCCVSVDRYVAVVYAVESRGLRQQKLAGTISLVICLVVSVGHLPVFTMQGANVETDLRRCFEPGQSSTTVTGFNYARFVIGFFIPLGILVATNRAILASVQASIGLQPHEKVKVKRLTITVITFFLVCFAPYHIILLLRAVMFHFPTFLESCHFESSIYTPYTISLGLSTINSAMNPILYILASDSIRRELRQLLANLRCWSFAHSHHNNSSQNRMHSSDAAAARHNHDG